MKQGSEYAKRLKRLLGTLLKKYGKPEDVEPTDPTEQLIIGVLAICTTHAKALATYKKLRAQVVDLNELRVTPAMELTEQIGDSVPLARIKAQRIVEALNAVRKRQDSLDLTFLKQRGRREAREYLEALEGVDRGVAASVMLFSLGGHAIPIDGLTLHVLQKEEVIDESADCIEVQGFLERNIAAAQAHAFYEALCRHAATKTVKTPLDQLLELVPAVKPPKHVPAPGLPLPPLPELLDELGPPIQMKSGKVNKEPVAEEPAAPARSNAKPAATAKPAAPAPAGKPASPPPAAKGAPVSAAKPAPAARTVSAKPAAPAAKSAKPETKKPKTETRAEPAAKGAKPDARAAAPRKKR